MKKQELEDLNSTLGVIESLSSDISSKNIKDKLKFAELSYDKIRPALIEVENSIIIGLIFPWLKRLCKGLILLLDLVLNKTQENM